MIDRRTLLAAAGCSLLAAAIDSQAARVDEVWHDPARQRDLPVAVRLPVTPGPWPVVLFSHGLGGSRDGGDAWGQAWAAAGCLVVHLQHPGSDTSAIRSGLRAAANAQQLVARVGDVRFALDELTRRQAAASTAGPVGASAAPQMAGAGTGPAWAGTQEPAAGALPWSQARLDAVGLAGHSFGAQTVQAVAGQRFPVASDFVEPRLKAFIALSPSSHRAGTPLQQPFGAITRPFLVVTGSLDGDPFGAFASGEPRAQVFEGLPAGQRALLWLDGADHMTFAGQAQRRIDGLGPFRRADGALEREPAHHAVVAAITSLWWRAHLQADEAARTALEFPSGLGGQDRWRRG